MMRTLRPVLLAASILCAVPTVHADWLWNRQTISGVGTIKTVEYGGGRFVAGTNTGYLLSTTNAVDWTVVRPTTRAINDIVYGHNRFVAIVDQVSGSKAKILYSSDGVSWTYGRRVANNGTFSSQKNLVVLGSRNGRFIGLGSETTAFANSVNGTRWQNPLNGKKPGMYAGSVSGLAVSGDYVMCSRLGGVTIQTSKDGVSWNTRFMTSARGPARGIAAQKPGKRVICVGENGLCMVSGSDGRSWRVKSFGSTDLLGVTANSSLFASFADKYVYSTPNGNRWTRQLKLARSGDHLKAIATGSGLYIAAGNNGKDGLILVSSAQPGPSTAQ